MSREIFGTDGIRGPAGQYPLDEAGTRQIGKAIGTYFAKPGQVILIGRDPRESSVDLEKAVTAGLTAVGVNVQLLGVIPTPGLAYVTKNSEAIAGVMITASHNLYSDNGIKVFSGIGGKLPDNVEAELNRLIDSDIPDRGQGETSDVRAKAGDYEKFLVSTMDGARLDGLSIAVDMANGATSGVARRVFEELGAETVSLFDQPDGKNINLNCGATDTKAVQEIVKTRQLDAGVAFDGDGDRVVLIDEKGRALSGDHVLYILALSRHDRGVVATVMSNLGLETALKGHGIALERTAVGDRYVLAGLEQTGFTLGGEQSGHIILPEYATTGDGLLAAIQALKHVRASGRSLAAWRDELDLLPQALVNINLDDKSLLESPAARAFIAGQTDKLAGKGRLLIRPSGTGPLVRVMVEAPDAPQVAERVANELKDLLAA
ncbi:MAG TPA: phosphoglucosamine mutase [Candidatus Saccharimonadales bacterium]